MDKQKILSTLAHNVRQEMNAADLSSVELARRCQISTGTISKILQGKMSISVAMVMTLAEGLEIDVSRLLRGLFNENLAQAVSDHVDEQDSCAFNIGIMSIKNRRLTCIKNMEGDIVGVSELSGGMDLAEPTSSLLSNIRQSIDVALTHTTYKQENLNTILKASKVNLVTQSYEFESTREKFGHFAERTFKEVNLMSDWQISYLSTFVDKPGISLITDKGVSLSYMYEGRLRKLGGWKFPVYDLGGENWLGVETIKHTIEAVEGYVPMTSLAQTVMAKFGGKIETITEVCFKGTKDPDIYCLFAEILLQAYWKQNATAKDIIARGFEAVYRMVTRVDEITGQLLPIAIMGSLMDIYKTFIEPSRLLVPASDEKKTELLADVTTDYLQKIGI